MIRHYTLTLTAAQQRLSQVLPGMTGSNAEPPAGDNIPFRQLIFSADPANTAAVYVGGNSSTVSATDHGFALDPTQASQGPVSIGPFESGPIKLSDFKVLGTNNERLMVLGVPF